MAKAKGTPKVGVKKLGRQVPNSPLKLKPAATPLVLGAVGRGGGMPRPNPVKANRG